MVLGMDTITVKVTLACLLALSYLPEVATQTYSIAIESDLRTELFTTGGYEVLQRPSRRVVTNVSLALFTINELDIKSQLLSISGFLQVSWSDSRLSWSNTSAMSKDYTGVSFLFSTETYVWRPALIIENSVDDISVISDTSVPMRITSSGLIIWTPSGIYKVSCESDTTYYPMDSQYCSIVLTTWGYTSGQISLSVDPDSPVSLSYYTPNGEWEIMSTGYSEGNDISRGGQSFSSVEFYLHLRRRPTFHVLNTMFPVSLMSVLISMVFKVPPESGEKIGFSLTVLLAYAVYLTLISDSIPSTSLTTCILSIYLALTFGIGVLSVLCTILVLNIYFKTDAEEIPKWLHKLTFKFLVRAACWKQHCCCKRKDRSSVNPIAVTRSQALPTPSKEKIAFTDSGNVSVPVTDRNGDDNDESLDWQTLALILDKFFFVLHILLIVLLTIILWLVFVIHFLISA